MSYSIYHIDLKIDVENHFLSSNVELTYYCNAPLTKEFHFYIYKDLQVEEVICDRNFTYEISSQIANWSPFVLESKLIKLSLNEPIHEGFIQMNFQYKGFIDIVSEYGVNRLSKNWIELGLYTPWFPLAENMEEAVFNVRIDIEDGYEVINSKREGEYLMIRQPFESQDCTVIASNSFKCIKNKSINPKVKVYYTADQYETSAYQITNWVSIILDKYQRFGMVEIPELSLVIAPREDGGGYARKGLIVLIPNDYEEDEDYFTFIAHELAHLWWYRAKTDSWQDWLNESFAEYSALLALREIFGEHHFTKKMKNHLHESKGLPPIRNISRNDNQVRKVLYVKGPVVLYELEKHIGREKFAELLHKVYGKKVTTTKEFLEQLEWIATTKAKDFFEKLLIK
ncbi:M1 family aminopeptidase [Niallia circulans]|uniref:Peptidase M1 membrane alanine aminopeptidase domain-containing protein n=1 Tax=Niallia circulans TaxID=1397 RepID=A0A941GFX6_NIACI|nr:M1 family aminopeptidase [Niallia circulans]MCB5239365.1 hypothetical protein [Niallia circulans]